MNKFRKYILDGLSLDEVNQERFTCWIKKDRTLIVIG